MNQIIIHFFNIAKNESVELLLDTRLSFRENFELFKDHKEIVELKDKQIMAKKGQYILDKDKPIGIFNLRPFTRLYIY